MPAIRVPDEANPAKLCDDFIRGRVKLKRFLNFHTPSLAWVVGQWRSRLTGLRVRPAVPMYVAFPMGNTLQGNIKGEGEMAVLVRANSQSLAHFCKV